MNNNYIYFQIIISELGINAYIPYFSILDGKISFKNYINSSLSFNVFIVYLFNVKTLNNTSNIIYSPYIINISSILEENSIGVLYVINPKKYESTKNING